MQRFNSCPPFSARVRLVSFLFPFVSILVLVGHRVRLVFLLFLFVSGLVLLLGHCVPLVSRLVLLLVSHCVLVSLLVVGHSPFLPSSPFVSDLVSLLSVLSPFCLVSLLHQENSMTFAGEVLEWRTFERDLKSR